MPKIESVEILNDGYITVCGDGLPARLKVIGSLDYAPIFTTGATITGGTTGLAISGCTTGLTSTDPITVTLTGETSSHIGLTCSQTTSAGYTGWSLGFFGTTTLSATGNDYTYNAAGGVFEVNFASAYTANQAGLVCGAYVGAYSSSTNGAARPTTALWIETIPGTGVDFTNVPLISFVTSGAGTKSAIMFELGNNNAGKTVTTTSGGMFYHQTIHMIANNTAYYIPVSTAEGTYTTAYPIVLGDDVELRFGAATGGDIALSWTGQELLVEDTRTIDVGDGYNRTLHISSTITMTASRYAAVSCYSTLTAGSGGISASGGSFSLVQGSTKTIDGHFQAVMAEVKNNAANCSTASALFCRWDNDNATGFGGVMHSFIRFEDNSSSTKVNNLFELYGMDMTTGASGSEIVCAKGNTTHTHCIKISANGVPYWIMVGSTAPA